MKMDKADPNKAVTWIDQAALTATQYVGLRISEIRYRRLFEAALDGVLLMDPASRKITDANPFMKTLLGYSHAELVGKELYEIGLLKDQEASRSMFSELQKNGHVRYENLPLANRDGSTHEVEVVANVYDENGSPVIQCNIRDISMRKLREAHNKLLVAEVNHRARNLLAVVQVIAQQTSKHGDHATFVDRLTERIGGLAACQDLLVENEWRGVQLVDLIKSQLEHFKDLFGTRLQFDGPPASLNAIAAQAIGMALHELGTNAGKYGALSDDHGRTDISWHVTTTGELFSMAWIEKNGPVVVPPTHRGFGQKVIEDMMEAAVDGTTKITYAPGGFSWQLTAASVDVLEPSP